MKQKHARNRILPVHIAGTLRQFKARKRREWRAIEKAAEVYRRGCAFAPVRTGALWAILEAGRDALSVKNWGR